MYLYLIVFLAGAVVTMALWRYILMAVYWTGMAFAVVFAWRVIERLTDVSNYITPIFVGAISGLTICVICSGYIRHALILFYLRENIEKQKQAATKGRLW